MVSVESRFEREVAAAGLPPPAPRREPVDEVELALLPATVQRYLRFMGVVGRPRDASFRARVRGRFRMGRYAAWKALDALQYNRAPPDVARLFYMKLPLYGVPVLGRDTYLRGKGRMLVRPLDLFTVQDGQGMEFDVGELVTWLNDAVLLAPSMLLVPSTTWREIDGRSFELTFHDRGNAATAQVFVDERGAVTDFHTRDRWYAPPAGPPERALWTTPVDGWARSKKGRMLPMGGRATWKLPEGDLTYVEVAFDPDEIEFDVPPP